MLRILKAVGARHVTFDVLFTEPSKVPEHDVALQLAVEGHAQVMLAYHFEQAEKCNEGLLTPDERAEYEMFVWVGDYISGLQAQARHLLAPA